MYLAKAIYRFQLVSFEAKHFTEHESDLSFGENGKETIIEIRLLTINEKFFHHALLLDYFYLKHQGSLLNVKNRASRVVFTHLRVLGAPANGWKPRRGAKVTSWNALLVVHCSHYFQRGWNRLVSNLCPDGGAKWLKILAGPTAR